MEKTATSLMDTSHMRTVQKLRFLLSVCILPTRQISEEKILITAINNRSIEKQAGICSQMC